MQRKSKDQLGLAYLIAGLTAVFGIAAISLGAPQLPTSWPHTPTPTDLEVLVRSPDRDQLPGALDLLTWAVWLTWGYVFATTLLRVLVIAVERLAEGAAWVRSFRTLSDLLTVAPIRRAVDASLAGVLFLRVATGAAAQELVVIPTAAQVQVYDVRAGLEASTPASSHYADHLRFAPDLQPGDVLYRVKPGDTLGAIALLFYGRVEAYELIYDANVGRLQPDGRTFTTAGQIWPGWLLVIPNPTEAGIETDADGQRWYTVRAGDSLASICARILGDENRWPELFALNEGARLPDGHTLLHPGLIWPDLRLRLPTDQPSAQQPVEQEAAEQPQEIPAPATSSPAPSQPTAATLAPAQATAVPLPVATATPIAVPTELTNSTPTVTAPAVTPVTATPSWAQLHWDLLDRSVAWPVPLGGALLGGSLLLAGRYLRRRRAPSSRFETSVEVSDGFAQAIGGDEASYEQPLAALAEQVLDVARQRGCPSLRLRGAAAGRTRATLLFRVASEETTALEVVSAGAGARPDAVRLTTMSAGTVRWDQEWSTVRPRPVAAAPDRPTVDLFPMGLTGDRRVLYGERSSGPVLVAGLASAGVWTLLSALVVDRLRRQSPRDLAVIAIARDDRLDPLLADAPQLRAAFVDPADSAAVNQALADIDEQLHRRLETGNVDLPDVVLVVDEWAELPDGGPTLDLLAHHGASVGMHLIAATAQVDDPRLERGVGLFGTRLVLQVPDESTSARLLGQAGAEELDRVGQALLFVDGEVLPRVRGFCVPPLHVQHLVARMRAQVEQDSNPSIFDDMRGDAEQHSANTDEDVPGEREIELQDESAETVVIRDRPGAQPAAASFQQVPLMPAVPMTPRQASAPTSASATATPPVSVELFGQDRITALEHELASTDGVSWELFRIVSCLPPGKASLARVAALKYPSDLDRKAAIQRLRQNKSNLQKAWPTVIGDDDARRILTLDSGVLWLPPDLVRVDVHTFLAAIYDGNRARQEQRLDEAIAAYSRAMALYAGPLLAGRDEDYEWLAQPVEGSLTLREGYRHQERLATERLAELLVATNRPGEAASLYADLMRDPGPPDVEADELEQFVFRQYAFREECARAVFECCRLTRDLPGLQRGYQELQDVLRALAADAGVPMGSEGTEPGAVTQARYEAVYADLTRSTSATASD